MILKMHWGHGIAIFFTLFVILLVSTVIFTTTINTGLVEEDYYAKDLAYQKHIEQVSRTNKLKTPLQIEFKALKQELHMTFPELGPSEAFSGRINLYRPSNKNLDYAIPISVDSSYTQILSIAALTKGLWRVKIFWNFKNTQYYNEVEITK